MNRLEQIREMKNSLFGKDSNDYDISDSVFSEEDDLGQEDDENRVSESMSKLEKLKSKYMDPATGRFKGKRGERFDNCVKYMAAKGGVKNPEGLCASIARKKGLV